MKYKTIYAMQKNGIYGHCPVNYDKIVKGAMDELCNMHYSTIPYGFHELIGVWKPQNKGPVGRSEIRFRNPIKGGMV